MSIANLAHEYTSKPAPGTMVILELYLLRVSKPSTKLVSIILQ